MSKLKPITVSDIQRACDFNYAQARRVLDFINTRATPSQPPDVEAAVEVKRKAFYQFHDENGDNLMDCVLVLTKDYDVPLIGDYKGVLLATIPFSGSEGKDKAERLAKIYCRALNLCQPDTPPIGVDEAVEKLIDYFCEALPNECNATLDTDKLRSILRSLHQPLARKPDVERCPFCKGCLKRVAEGGENFYVCSKCGAAARGNDSKPDVEAAVEKIMEIALGMPTVWHEDHNEPKDDKAEEEIRVLVTSLCQPLSAREPLVEARGKLAEAEKHLTNRAWKDDHISSADACQLTLRIEEAAAILDRAIAKAEKEE